MPAELPFCRGEYWWSQREPQPAAVIAVLQLPHRCSIAASFGQDLRRQSLTFALVQSPTGLGHLILSDLQHHGCAEEPDVTADLFDLLLNTTVTILDHHCQRQVTLGGLVVSALLPGPQQIELDWDGWGFQVLTAAAPAHSRILARVRNLKYTKRPSRTAFFPAQLAYERLQWTTN